MKARTAYWISIELVFSGVIVVITLFHLDFVTQVLLTLTWLMVPLSIVLKYKPDDEIRFKTPKILKGVKTQLVRWMWYNLLIFPVLMAFYIPYNVFWLQYTPIQILKFVATNGFFGAIVNFVLRPWNAWITRFIERRNKK